MFYDDWKLATPPENESDNDAPEEEDERCDFCGRRPGACGCDEAMDRDVDEWVEDRDGPIADRMAP
jgi:hypothetical protein